MLYNFLWEMVKFRCPKCKKTFKSGQALAVHKAWSKSCGSKYGHHQDRPAEKVETLPAPAQAAAPAEKGISVIWEKKWDPAWSDSQKFETLSNESGLSWGLRKRNGRWFPVVMAGTRMSYGQAVIRADKFNFIQRLLPRRPSPPPPDETAGEDLEGTLFLAWLASRL
jgi:hypothetical protein